MKQFFSVFLLLVIQLLLSAAPVYGGRCYIDNSTGFPLPVYRDPRTGQLACTPGFYCPGFNASNPSTYPVACPPLPDCALLRGWGQTCDAMQGDHEPVVCKLGYYCPLPNGSNPSRMIKCPSNAYCHYGSVEPNKCPAFAVCFGNDKILRYGPAIIWLAASILLTIAILFYRRFGLSSTLSNESREGEPVTAYGALDKQVGVQTVSEQDRFNDKLVAGFQRSRGGSPPLRFEFDHLSVSVNDRATGKPKELLRDMSGTMEPGTVTAIMGPSGCGKTTFMMSLLGKIDPSWKTTGRLQINGEPVDAAIAHRIGFVPQDDVLHKELSVYKNLYYSSETRLPQDWSGDDRHAFRSAVVGALGLTAQRDVPIGDEHERGVSGGQRKRCSIGVELAAAPLALFLDEPTSGLDSTTSLELCTSLKKIASETDLTVGMVIHQPRIEIWNALDQVLLLGRGGRVVYQGHQVAAQKYFEQKCGIFFPPQSNPADVIIDAIARSSDELAEIWRQHVEETTSPTTGSAGQPRVAFAPPVDTGAQPQSVVAPSEAGTIHGMDYRSASFLRQIILAHNRSIEKQLARLDALRLEMITSILVGLVLGWSYQQNEYNGMYKPPYDRVSPITLTDFSPQMFMYNAMSVGLFAAPAGVRPFNLDRQSYFREAAAGHFRLAYFIGIVVSNIFRVAYVSFLFTTTYSMMGVMPIDFWPFWGSMFFLMWCTYSLAFAISMVASQRMAPLIAQVTAVCVAVFNGYIDYPIWLKQISYSFHSAQILANLWYKTTDRVFQPQLSQWGYREGTVGESLGVLFCMSLILQLIAFLLMVWLDRDKQR